LIYHDLPIKNGGSFHRYRGSIFGDLNIHQTPHSRQIRQSWEPHHHGATGCLPKFSGRWMKVAGRRQKMAVAVFF